MFTMAILNKSSGTKLVETWMIGYLQLTIFHQLLARLVTRLTLRMNGPPRARRELSKSSEIIILGSSILSRKSVLRFNLSHRATFSTQIMLILQLYLPKNPLLQSSKWILVQKTISKIL